MVGNILFEDAHVSKIAFCFETPDERKEFNDLEDLERLMWDLEYKKQKHMTSKRLNFGKRLIR